MAGPTAAHELVERGFDVTVYEPAALGGQARSIPSPGTAAGGRLDLPGEHGFRFFPGFYQHIPDTMRRIPFPGNPNGVFDNLAAGNAFRLALPGAPDLTAPASIAPLRADIYDPATLQQSPAAAFSLGGAIPPHELAVFLRKLGMFLTSSIERRDGEWEHRTWSQALEGEGKSQGYRDILVSALTRQLVAARPAVVSTRTVGIMGQAFVWNAMGTVPTYGHLDRLRDLGGRFEMGWAAEALEMSGGSISAARMMNGSGGTATAEADWFVAAMPVERAVPLWSPQILAADPRLEGMRRLHTDWMVGIQYFLRHPTPIAKGHVAYLGSPWALTSISQAQFWRGDFADRYGDGSAHDCLSVDISDWDTPGILFGRTATKCTREEIAKETWAQMAACLADNGDSLDENDVVSWFIDPGLHWGTGGITNGPPLLVNTVGSRENRPDARTAIPNLFLSGDYVRTDIDLATMESANESARTLNRPHPGGARPARSRTGAGAKHAVVLGVPDQSWHRRALRFGPGPPYRGRGAHPLPRRLDRRDTRRGRSCPGARRAGPRRDRAAAGQRGAGPAGPRPVPAHRSHGAAVGADRRGIRGDIGRAPTGTVPPRWWFAPTATWDHARRIRLRDLGRILRG